MPKGISDKVTFKPYDQSQGELIPPTADELIPADHLVRVVSSTIDQLNLEVLRKRYKHGGGASRYNPVMLLKVLIYGYLNNACSSRMLAKHVRENIYFRWIAGCQQPDFRTINSFRKQKLAPVIDEVFVAVVQLLQQQGYVQLNILYVDGTKVESRANRYSFVWRKSVEKYYTKLEEKVRVFLQEAKQITDDENLEFGDEDLPEMGQGPISSETISAMADRLNQVLENLSEDPEQIPKQAKKNS
jgi:transposase